jgi:RHS repeat-associated protein
MGDAFRERARGRSWQAAGEAFREGDGQRSWETLKVSPPEVIGDHVEGDWRVVWVHADHLGSVRMTSLANQTIVSRHTYEPFGWEVPRGFLSSNTHRFTGHERDATTGLDYMLARYYANSQARFLSVDPAGKSAARELPQTWNRYAYSRNTPIARYDPDGRKDEYLKYSSTRRAILDAFHRYRYHASAAGVPRETSTAAFETDDGKTTLVKSTAPLDNPGQTDHTGPSGTGAPESDAGSVFRGDAHVHPSVQPAEDTAPSAADQSAHINDNLETTGVDPRVAPESAVDSYIITPDGRVFRTLVNPAAAEPVTTIDEVRRTELQQKGIRRND